MGHWPPRRDPGPCPICATAQCACTSDNGQIAVAQLPHRDAMLQATTDRTDAPVVATPPAAPTVSTATYRGDPRKRRR
jgi:hypothetical protein